MFKKNHLPNVPLCFTEILTINTASILYGFRIWDCGVTLTISIKHSLFQIECDQYRQTGTIIEFESQHHLHKFGVGTQYLSRIISYIWLIKQLQSKFSMECLLKFDRSGGGSVKFFSKFFLRENFRWKDECQKTTIGGFPRRHIWGGWMRREGC